MLIHLHSFVGFFLSRVKFCLVDGKKDIRSISPMVQSNNRAVKVTNPIRYALCVSPSTHRERILSVYLSKVFVGQLIA